MSEHSSMVEIDNYRHPSKMVKADSPVFWVQILWQLLASSDVNIGQDASKRPVESVHHIENENFVVIIETERHHSVYFIKSWSTAQYVHGPTVVATDDTAWDDIVSALSAEAPDFMKAPRLTIVTDDQD